MNITLIFARVIVCADNALVVNVNAFILNTKSIRINNPHNPHINKITKNGTRRFINEQRIITMEFILNFQLITSQLIE
jgi:hypothetical protein